MLTYCKENILNCRMYRNLLSLRYFLKSSITNDLVLKNNQFTPSLWQNVYVKCVLLKAHIKYFCFRFKHMSVLYSSSTQRLFNKLDTHKGLEENTHSFYSLQNLIENTNFGKYIF